MLKKPDYVWVSSYCSWKNIFERYTNNIINLWNILKRKLGSRVDQEKLLKTLVNVGLTQLDAEVYLLLAKKGPIKARDATKALKLSKQRFYPIIKNLQRKGVVTATLEHPAMFSAVAFKKVLDLFVKSKMAEAQHVQKHKEDLLLDWQSVDLSKAESPSAKFAVIEGRNCIYSKIQQMIEETKSRLSFVTTVPSLARADVIGLFEAAFSHPLRSKIQFRFLTELSKQNVETMKKILKEKPKASFNLEIKSPDLGLKLCPRMIIKDESETVFFLENRIDASAIEQDDVCLWTNCKSLVQSFSAMFEDLWHNSTDVENRFKEIATSKSSPRTVDEQDKTRVHTKYINAILAAEREIIMMTSPESLFNLWKNKNYSQKWVERGVSLKIMAPLSSKNFKAIRQLSQFIEVRHVPQSYLETTIVDGKHLFQFKESYATEGKYRKTEYFRDTFYTDDLEQVGKMANTMKDIWKNAHPSSSVTPQQTKPYGFMPPPLSSNHWKAVKNVIVSEEKSGIAEEDVINKMISSNKALAGERLMFATAALAIVHPPDNFNLPDMMFQINQVDKQSIFGRGDSLLLYLWVETPEGYFFVPSGGLGDNPEGIAYRREIFFTESNAKQSYRLVKEDELQIRVYGNSLFCGWTVPIQLYPFKYVLPPACILVEGYGKVKTKAFSISLPSGFESAMEYNYFDAFVTFMHPSSKYSGPGTDGAFIRDLVTTNKSFKK
jgi:sugar-specific transcriptional regulator TrmB